MRWGEKVRLTDDLYGMYMDEMRIQMTYNLPEGVKVGNYFVSHGAGIIGRIIRSVTEDWAGHAGVYVGQFCLPGDLPGKPSHVIVEATWPKVRYARASRHPDARWNIHEELNPVQRTTITTRAKQLVGTGYDVLAYPIIAAAIFRATITRDLAPLFTNDHWRDCSAVVADCYDMAGIAIEDPTCPNFVTPGYLDQRIAHQDHYRTLRNSE